WSPGKGYSVSFLSEGNSNEKEGIAQDARDHNLFQLDRQWKTGMKLNLFHDTLATVTAGKDKPTITTDFLHFETNRTKPINILAESKRVRMSDGKFEDTDIVDLNPIHSK